MFEFYPALIVSLSCLALAVIIGIVIWAGMREARRRKEQKEEALKRRIEELTGQDFVSGVTSVKDLERKYGKKG